MLESMNYTGNTEYKNIQDKQFLTVDSDKISDIIAELNKQDIPYSARYDEKKITVTFTKGDFEKVNSVINSFKEVPNSIEKDPVNIALEELKKQVQEIAEDQRRLQQLAEDQKKEQAKEQSQESVSETVKQTETNPQQDKEVEAAINISKESLRMLPIISTAVVKQEQRIEDLVNLRQISEDKITKHQERIEKLTTKAERLNTTNQMLNELINNKSTPNAVKDSIRAVIKVNEQKIAKIRNEKIPKREQKIEKRQSKIERLDKKINLAQCKINRHKSFNKVVTSFSLINNADRRKQFSTAMDKLHNNSIELLNAKIDNSTAMISHLTKTYKENPILATSLGVSLDLKKQKLKRQRYIDKRNKLMGVVIPYVSQPENVQNEVLKQAEAVVNTALGQEQVSATEVAESVAVSPLPSLPEQSIVEPDTIDMSLLPEIAEIMDMSVSELESKPMDIKSVLILDYTNNYESSIENIQASLSNIINPNQKVEQNLEQSKKEKQKENPLKNVEELVEGNATKPKEEHTEPKTFYFGRSSMNRNAQKIANEHRGQTDKIKKKDPPNHDSL